MRNLDDRDIPRQKKKSKKKSSARFGLRTGLWIGATVAAILVIGLSVWGVVRLLSPGGLSGAVVADARPVGDVKIWIDSSPDKPPIVNLPTASDGWEVTPDGVPPASGLASAVVLPDGQPRSLLFADPARARAAVILVKLDGPPKQGIPADAMADWAQIDLKTDTVVATTRLGTHKFVAHQDGWLPSELYASALSPSGDRLAAIVPRGKESALVVWDSAGKVLREWTDAQVFAGYWLAFAGEDRLLSLGAANVSGLDVASGGLAFTSGEAVKQPLALSPGRKWLAAASATGGVTVFNTSDGTVAGSKAKPLADDKTPASLAFTPDATALTVTAARSVGWLSPRYVMLENETIFDVEAKLALWRYQRRYDTQFVRPGPDGRVWSIRTFKDSDAKEEVSKFAAGPIADAAKAGKTLLTAYTAPHASVTAMVARAEKGMIFRRGEPVRVEVVGSGDTEMKKLAADAAAVTLAGRGQPVDPDARLGVRIKLSSPQSVTVVTNYPGAPIPTKVDPNTTSPGYQIEYEVRFFNRDNSCVTSPVGKHALHGAANGGLDAIYKNVANRAADFGGPLDGAWDAEGKIQLLGTSTLGIDGVLER